MEVKEQVDLQPLNTLAVPSTAEFFCEPESINDIRAAVRWASSKSYEIRVLGDGSNVILSDHVSGLVLKPKILGRALAYSTKDGSREEAILRLGAGENWHQVVEWCLTKGLYGLERLALIPGTVGAAPVQNIGAYGIELSQFVESVEYFDFKDFESFSLNAQQCRFAYRDSIFKHELKERVLITHVSLRLSTNRSLIPSLDRDSLYPALRDAIKSAQTLTPEYLFNAVCKIRRSKLPAPEDIPNCGSFFKNPVVSKRVFDALRYRYPKMPFYPVKSSNRVKLAAGWLIEQAGWKGKELGGARVHDKQALVLTNPKALPATQVLCLAKEIQASIKEEFGVALEVEPQVLGGGGAR